MKEKWIQGDLFSTDNVEHIEKNSDPLLINESVPNKGNKGENSARENSGEKTKKRKNEKTNRKNTGNKPEIFSDEAVIFYLGDLEKLRSDLSEMKNICGKKGSEYEFGSKNFVRYFVRTRCKNCTQVDFNKCLNAVHTAIGIMKKNEKIKKKSIIADARVHEKRWGIYDNEN